MARARSSGQLTQVAGEARRILGDGAGRGEEGRGAVGSELVVEMHVGDRLLDRRNERRADRAHQDTVSSPLHESGDALPCGAVILDILNDGKPGPA